MNPRLEKPQAAGVVVRDSDRPDLHVVVVYSSDFGSDLSFGDF